MIFFLFTSTQVIQCADVILGPVVSESNVQVAGRTMFLCLPVRLSVFVGRPTARGWG